jgi:3-oxoacyl-[acyl-carrier-protein] synthase II
MGALSERPDSTASRPFDKTRDGFVLSEGACVLVLEDMDEARRRGARIYGEIVGYANTVDALHLTRPDRRGEADAIRSALVDAGIPARSVDYISTHGTSTQIGDRIEAGAIEDVFGNYLPASAIKSMTGHMLAASGPFEIACALMSMKENIIPPTINLRERDDNCRIGISAEKREMSIGYAISNTFGFGGVNAVLVMKSCP